MRLKDKVALFAGAGSNMSRATALLFAQEGAKIMLAARTTETMDETAERIRANGGDVLTHQTDLTDAASVSLAAFSFQALYYSWWLFFCRYGIGITAIVADPLILPRTI